MPLKTSFFSRGIFKSNLKRFWLIPFSYAFFLLLVVMGFLSSASSTLFNNQDLNYRLMVNVELFRLTRIPMIFFIGFYTLVSALAVFSYMQFPRSTAMVHALPVKRSTLYATNYLSGLFMATGPLLLDGLILVAYEAMTGFPRIELALLWIGACLVLSLLLYSFAVFAGMFTGHLAAQAIFFLIFNFLAVFLETMVKLVLSNFLYGYSTTSALQFGAWSPLYNLIDLFQTIPYNKTDLYLGYSQSGGAASVIAGYLIAALLFAAFGYWLYLRRNMEVATDVISLRIVKPIFKYSVAFCSAALIGSLFVTLLNLEEEFSAYLIAYLVGGFIGYFASEMLLKKTFRVFKAYRGYLVFALAIVLLLLSINLDLFGYERHIPKDGDIEIAYMSQYADPTAMLALQPEKYNAEEHRYIFSSPELVNNPPYRLSEDLLRELRKIPGILDSREAINKARQIHAYIIENQERFADNARFYKSHVPSLTREMSEYRSYSLFFTYRLKSGTLVQRQYYLICDPKNTEFENLMREYVKIPGVREKYEPVLEKTPEDVRSITVSFSTKENPYQGYDIKDIAGFLKAYQADLLSLDPLEHLNMAYKTEAAYRIDVSFDFFTRNEFNYFDSRASRPLDKSFKNTIDFLVDSGLITREQLAELQVAF